MSASAYVAGATIATDSALRAVASPSSGVCKRFQNNPQLLHHAGMAESAQETFARLLKDVVAPALREAGLRGSGSGYFLPDEEWWAQLGFQKSTSSDQATVKFTVNLKATLKADWDEWRRDHSYLKDRPPEGVSKLEWDRQRLDQSPVPSRPSPNTDIGVRIGQLIPPVRGDHWWYLRAGDPDNVMSEALDAVKRYAIPALENRIRAGFWGDGS